MRLATRAFDTLLASSSIRDLPDFVAKGIPQLLAVEHRDTWRRTVRMAALLHDAGHVPFSHHLGISYGRSDLDRVIASLRITFKPQEGERQEDQSAEPMLGIDEGGMYAAGAF